MGLYDVIIHTKLKAEMNKMQEVLEKLWSFLLELATSVGLKLVYAALILVIGLKLSSFITKRLSSGKLLAKTDPNVKSFTISFCKILLNALVLFSAAVVLGVPAASFVTVLASCGLAIGLALQGSLSNFAGGLMILIFKPFEIGDFIEGGGFSGTVQSISILYTRIVTAENNLVSLPNGSLSDGAVVNYTANGSRRVDLNLPVPFGSDLKAVKSILLEAAEKNVFRIKENEPTVEVGEIGDSALIIYIRIHAKPETYWDAWFALRRDVLEAMEEHGIEIPYNQLDVHTKQ